MKYTLAALDPVRVHTACVWEVTARKVGNVHPSAGFADLNYLDFVHAAGALASAIATAAHAPFGNTVFNAVNLSRMVTLSNTNLGIILLLVPLSHRGPALRDELVDGLRGLTVHDAEMTYLAIQRARPGGLAEVPDQDIFDTPTVTLLEAMTLAAGRDLIARQYANGFADVFDFGVPAFLDAFAKFGRIEPAVIECQLKWLATYPDSLIARKNGPAVAEDVRRLAADVLNLGGLDTPEGRTAGFALDWHLRSDGNRLNPGTTADLVTACLFVALRENKVKPSDPFRWDAPDWL